MKRITIVAAFALISAVGSGCIGQTSTTEESDESTLVTRRTHAVANGQPDENAPYAGGPARALELQSHSTDDGQGPHPEPWLDQQGPHPEPWQGKMISTEPDPDPNNSGNGKP